MHQTERTGFDYRTAAAGHNYGMKKFDEKGSECLAGLDGNAV